MSQVINSEILSSRGREHSQFGAQCSEDESAQLSVNDLHSRLNQTQLRSMNAAVTCEELVAKINSLRQENRWICVSGGRHSMGGQQFRDSGDLLDTTNMKRILHFNREVGLVEVESGCLWSDLIPALKVLQEGDHFKWAVAQKQTGCDRLSIGGALSANAHGRGLTMSPLSSDVESFKLVKADGQTVQCSRVENQELFSLVAGGYGLFGVIYSVTLRLVPAIMLRRTVQLCSSAGVIKCLETKAAAGAVYGDFQFNIDDKDANFLKSGILSVYSPIEEQPCRNTSAINKALAVDDWLDLICLAHKDKARAFKNYTEHYLSTNGQVYSSDEFQMATYIDGYHEQVDKKNCASETGSEIITELYVPRHHLKAFLDQVADRLRKDGADLIYGTVRLIEKDSDSLLSWAKQRWACVVLNLHVNHQAEQIARAGSTFRALIDLAIKFNGCYYLTYHRFASAEQLLACYPEFNTFVELKIKYDPTGLFRSTWFDHCLSIL